MSVTPQEQVEGLPKLVRDLVLGGEVPQMDGDAGRRVSAAWQRAGAELAELAQRLQAEVAALPEAVRGDFGDRVVADAAPMCRVADDSTKFCHSMARHTDRSAADSDKEVYVMYAFGLMTAYQLLVAGGLHPLAATEILTSARARHLAAFRAFVAARAGAGAAAAAAWAGPLLVQAGGFAVFAGGIEVGVQLGQIQGLLDGHRESIDWRAVGIAAAAGAGSALSGALGGQAAHAVVSRADPPVLLGRAVVAAVSGLSGVIGGAATTAGITGEFRLPMSALVSGMAIGMAGAHLHARAHPDAPSAPSGLSQHEKIGLTTDLTMRPDALGTRERALTAAGESAVAEFLPGSSDRVAATASTGPVADPNAALYERIQQLREQELAETRAPAHEPEPTASLSPTVPPATADNSVAAGGEIASQASASGSERPVVAETPTASGGEIAPSAPADPPESTDRPADGDDPESAVTDSGTAELDQAVAARDESRAEFARLLERSPQEVRWLGPEPFEWAVGQSDRWVGSLGEHGWAELPPGVREGAVSDLHKRVGDQAYADVMERGASVRQWWRQQQESAEPPASSSTEQHWEAVRAAAANERVPSVGRLLDELERYRTADARVKALDPRAADGTWDSAHPRYEQPDPVAAVRVTESGAPGTTGADLTGAAERAQSAVDAPSHSEPAPRVVEADGADPTAGPDGHARTAEASDHREPAPRSAEAEPMADADRDALVQKEIEDFGAAASAEALAKVRAADFAVLERESTKAGSALARWLGLSDTEFYQMSPSRLRAAVEFHVELAERLPELGKQAREDAGKWIGDTVRRDMVADVANGRVPVGDAVNAAQALPAELQNRLREYAGSDAEVVERWMEVHATRDRLLDTPNLMLRLEPVVAEPVPAARERWQDDLDLMLRSESVGADHVLMSGGRETQPELVFAGAGREESVGSRSGWDEADGTGAYSVPEPSITSERQRVTDPGLERVRELRDKESAETRQANRRGSSALSAEAAAMLAESGLAPRTPTGPAPVTEAVGAAADPRSSSASTASRAGGPDGDGTGPYSAPDFSSGPRSEPGSSTVAEPSRELAGGRSEGGPSAVAVQSRELADLLSGRADPVAEAALEQARQAWQRERAETVPAQGDSDAGTAARAGAEHTETPPGSTETPPDAADPASQQPAAAKSAPDVRDVAGWSGAAILGAVPSDENVDEAADPLVPQQDPQSTVREPTVESAAAPADTVPPTAAAEEEPPQDPREAHAAATARLAELFQAAPQELRLWGRPLLEHTMDRFEAWLASDGYGRLSPEAQAGLLDRPAEMLGETARKLADERHMSAVLEWLRLERLRAAELAPDGTSVPQGERWPAMRRLAEDGPSAALNEVLEAVDRYAATGDEVAKLPPVQQNSTEQPEEVASPTAPASPTSSTPRQSLGESWWFSSPLRPQWIRTGSELGKLAEKLRQYGIDIDHWATGPESKELARLRAELASRTAELAQLLGITPEDVSARRIGEALAAALAAIDDRSDPATPEDEHLIELAESRALLVSVIGAATRFSQLTARIPTAGPDSGRSQLGRLVQTGPGELRRRLRLLGLSGDLVRPPTRPRRPSPGGEPPPTKKTVSVPPVRRSERRPSGPVAEATPHESTPQQPLAPVAGPGLTGKPDGESVFQVPDVPTAPTPIDCAARVFQYLKEENPNAAAYLADAPPMPDAGLGGTDPKRILSALRAKRWAVYETWDEIADLLDNLGPGAAAYVVTESRHARRVGGKDHARLFFHDRAQPRALKWRDPLVDGGAKRLFEGGIQFPSGLALYAVVRKADGTLYSASGDSTTDGIDPVASSPVRAVAGVGDLPEPRGEIADRDIDTQLRNLATSLDIAETRAKELDFELSHLAAMQGTRTTDLWPDSAGMAEWTYKFDAAANGLAQAIDVYQQTYRRTRSGGSMHQQIVSQLRRPELRQRIFGLIERLQRGLESVDARTRRELVADAPGGGLRDLIGLMGEVLLVAEADAADASAEPNHPPRALDPKLAHVLAAAEQLPRRDAEHRLAIDPLGELRLLRELRPDGYVAHRITAIMDYLEIGRIIELPSQLIEVKTEIARLRDQKFGLELMRLIDRQADAAEIARVEAKRAENMEAYCQLRLQTVAAKFDMDVSSYTSAELREWAEELGVDSSRRELIAELGTDFSQRELLEEVASAVEDYAVAVDERIRVHALARTVASGLERVSDPAPGDRDVAEPFDVASAIDAELNALDVLVRVHGLRNGLAAECGLQPANAKSEFARLRGELRALEVDLVDVLVNTGLISHWTELTPGAVRRADELWAQRQSDLRGTSEEGRLATVDQRRADAARYLGLRHLHHYVDQSNRLAKECDAAFARIHDAAGRLATRWGLDRSEVPPQPSKWVSGSAARVFEPTEQAHAEHHVWGERIAAAADRRRRVFSELVTRARPLEVAQLHDLRPHELRDAIDALVSWGIAYRTATAEDPLADEGYDAFTVEQTSQLLLDHYFPLLFAAHTVERATRAEAATAVARDALRREVIDGQGGQWRAPLVAVVEVEGEPPQVFVAGPVSGLDRALDEVEPAVRADLERRQARFHFREFVVDEDGRVFVHEVEPPGRAAAEPDQPRSIEQPPTDLLRAAVADELTTWLDRELPFTERVAEGVAFSADGTGGGILVVAAPPGMHMRVLSDLALADPRFAGALWRPEFDKRYVRVTPSPDGTPVAEICSASEAERWYREPTVDEIEGILLAEYLRFRQLGLVDVGFGDWLGGLGKRVFASTKRARKDKQARGAGGTPTAASMFKQDGTLQAFGYALAKSATTAVGADLAHPTAVLIRALTRQFVLPDIAEPGAERPGPASGSLVLRAEVDVGRRSTVVEIRNDGDEWRLAPPNGHGAVSDVVSRWFEGLSDPDPELLLHRVAQQFVAATPGAGTDGPIWAPGLRRDFWQQIVSFHGRPVVIDIWRGEVDWQAWASPEQEIDKRLGWALHEGRVRTTYDKKGVSRTYIWNTELMPLLRGISAQLTRTAPDQSLQRPGEFGADLSPDALDSYRALVLEVAAARDRLRAWDQKYDALVSALSAEHPAVLRARHDPESTRELERYLRREREVLADTLGIQPTELASIQPPEDSPEARRSETLWQIEEFTEHLGQHGELATAVSETQRARDGFLTGRIVDLELAGVDGARRLTDQVGYVPNAAGGVLIVAAPKGGHMRSLTRLAVAHPSFADALWREGLVLRYLLVTPQPDGRIEARPIPAQEAEATRPKLDHREVNAQLLHHYLIYRQAGLISAGFREWLDQLGPNAFDYEFGRRGADDKPIGILKDGYEVLPLGYRMVLADPTIGQSHPAHVLYRLHTRQLPSLTSAGHLPVMTTPYLTNLGDAVSESLYFERDMHPGTPPRWHVVQGSGKPINDVLTNFFGDVAVGDPREFIDHVETYLRGRGHLDAYDSHSITQSIPENCFLVAADATATGPGQPRIDIPKDRRGRVVTAGVHGRDAARWARANWHPGGYPNAAAMVEHVRRLGGTILGAVDFGVYGAHAFTVKMARDEIVVVEQAVRYDENGVAVVEVRTVRGDAAVDLWAAHLAKVAGPNATYHGLAFKSDGVPELQLDPDGEPAGRPGIEFPIHLMTGRPPERGPPDPDPDVELGEHLRRLRTDAAAELERQAAIARDALSDIDPTLEVDGVSLARSRDRIEHIDALTAALAAARAQQRRATADLTARIAACRDLDEREVGPGSEQLWETPRLREAVRNLLVPLLDRADAADSDLAYATLWLQELDDVIRATADYEYRTDLLAALERDLAELDTRAELVRTTRSEVAEERTRLGSTSELAERLRDEQSAFDSRVQRTVRQYVDGGRADLSSLLTSERQLARFDAMELTEWLRQSDALRRYSLSETQRAELLRVGSPIRAEWTRALDALYEQLRRFVPGPPDPVATRDERMRAMAEGIRGGELPTEYSEVFEDFVARLDVLSTLDGIDRRTRRVERIDALGALVRDIRSWLADSRGHGRPVEVLAGEFDRIATLTNHLDRLAAAKNRLPEMDELEFSSLSAMRGFRHWQLRPGRRGQQRLDLAVVSMRAAAESFLGQELENAGADGLARHAKQYRDKWFGSSSAPDLVRRDLGLLLGRAVETVGEDELTELAELHRAGTVPIPGSVLVFLRGFSAQRYLELRRIAKLAELAEEHRRLDAEWDDVLAEAVQGLRGVRFADGGRSRPIERTFALGSHLAGLRDSAVEQRAAAAEVVGSFGRRLRVESVWHLTPGSETLAHLEARVEQRYAELDRSSDDPAERDVVAEIRAVEPVVDGARRFHRYDAWARAIDALDESVNAARWDEAQAEQDPAADAAVRAEKAAWARQLIEWAHLLDDVAAARAAAIAEQRVADIATRESDLDRLFGEVAALIAIRAALDGASSDSAGDTFGEDRNAAYLPPDVRRGAARRVDERRALLVQELGAQLGSHGIDPGQLLEIGSEVWEQWFTQHEQARNDLVRLLAIEQGRVDDRWLHQVAVHRQEQGDVSAELATATKRFTGSYAVSALLGAIGWLARWAHMIESVEAELVRQAVEFRGLVAQARGMLRVDDSSRSSAGWPGGIEGVLAVVIRKGGVLQRMEGQVDRLYRIGIAVEDTERQLRSLEPTRARFVSSVRDYGLAAPGSRPDMLFVNGRLVHLIGQPAPAVPPIVAPAATSTDTTSGITRPIRDLSELLRESTMIVRLEDQLYWLKVDLDECLEGLGLELSGVPASATRPARAADDLPGSGQARDDLVPARTDLITRRRHAAATLASGPNAEFGIDPTKLDVSQDGDDELTRLLRLRGPLAATPDHAARLRRLDTALDLVRTVLRMTALVDAIDLIAAAFDEATRRRDRAVQQFARLSANHVRRFPLDHRIILDASGERTEALDNAVALCDSQLVAAGWDVTVSLDDLRRRIDLVRAQPNTFVNAAEFRMAGVAERYVGLCELQEAFDERNLSTRWYYSLQSRVRSLGEYSVNRHLEERRLDMERRLSSDPAAAAGTKPGQRDRAVDRPRQLRRLLKRALSDLARSVTPGEALRAQTRNSPEELDVRLLMSLLSDLVFEFAERPGADVAQRRADRSLRLCLMIAAAEQTAVSGKPTDLDREFANLLHSAVTFALRQGAVEEATPTTVDPPANGHARNQCGVMVVSLHWRRTGKPGVAASDGGLGGVFVEDFVHGLGGGDPQEFPIDPESPLRFVVEDLLKLVEGMAPGARNGVSVVPIEGMHKVDEHGVSAHTLRLEYECDERGENVRILLQDPGKGLDGVLEYERDERGEIVRILVRDMSKGLDGVADEYPTTAAELAGLWAVAYDKHRNPLVLPGGGPGTAPKRLRIGRSDERIRPEHGICSVASDSTPSLGALVLRDGVLGMDAVQFEQHWRGIITGVESTASAGTAVAQPAVRRFLDWIRGRGGNRPKKKVADVGLRRLYTGSIISSAATVGLSSYVPLLAQQLSNSVQWAGLATSAVEAARLLTRPTAGYIADRYDNRRTIQITSSVGLATSGVTGGLILLGLPGGAPVLVGSAVALSIANTIGSASTTTYGRRLAAEHQQTSAVTLSVIERQGSGTVGRFIIPAMASVSPAAPFFADAASYALYLRMLHTLPSIEPAPGEHVRMLDGARATWRDPYLRGNVLLLFPWGVGNAIVNTQLVNLIATYDYSAVTSGVLLAAGAAGIMLAVLVPQRIRNRINLKVSDPVNLAATGILAASYAVTTNPWLILPLLIANGVGAMIGNERFFLYQKDVVPQKMIGGALAASGVMGAVGGMVGGVLGGYLLSTAGVVTTGWLAGGLFAATSAASGVLAFSTRARVAVGFRRALARVQSNTGSTLVNGSKRAAASALGEFPMAAQRAAGGEFRLAKESWDELERRVLSMPPGATLLVVYQPRARVVRVVTLSVPMPGALVATIAHSRRRPGKVEFFDAVRNRKWTYALGARQAHLELSENMDKFVVSYDHEGNVVPGSGPRALPDFPIGPRPARSPWHSAHSRPIRPLRRPGVSSPPDETQAAAAAGGEHLKVESPPLAAIHGADTGLGRVGATPWSARPSREPAQGRPSGGVSDTPDGSVRSGVSTEGRTRDGDEPVPPETREFVEDLPPLTIHFCTKDRPERMAALLDDIAAVVPGTFTVFVYDDSVDPQNRTRNRHAIDKAPFDVVYIDEERRAALLAGMPWPSEAAERFAASAFKVLGLPEWDFAGVVTFLQKVAVVCGEPSDRVLLLNDDIRLRDGIFQGELVSVDSQAVTELLSTPVPDGTFIGISGHYAGKKDVNHVEDAAATVGAGIAGRSYLDSGLDASSAFCLTNIKLLAVAPFPNSYGEDNFLMSIWRALGNVLDTTDFSPLHTGDDRDLELDVALRQQYGIVAVLAVLEAGREGVDNVFELLENAVSYCGKYAWKVAQRWAENFAIREHEFGNIHIDNVSALLAVEDIAGSAEAALRGYASSLIGWTDLVQSREVTDHVRSFLGIGGGKASVPWSATAPRPSGSYADGPGLPELGRAGNSYVDVGAYAADGTTRQSLSGEAVSAVGVSADGTVVEDAHSDFTTANRRIIDYALGKLRGNVYDSIGMVLTWVEVSVRAALAADPEQNDVDADYRVARATWEITSEHVLDKIVDSVTRMVQERLGMGGSADRWWNELRERMRIPSDGITPAEDFIRVAEAVLAYGVTIFWEFRKAEGNAEIYTEFCRSRNLSDGIVQRWYSELGDETGFSVDEIGGLSAFRELVTGTDDRAVESLVSWNVRFLADRLGSLHFAWYSAAPEAKLGQWKISAEDPIHERRWIAPERHDLLSDFMREFRKPVPDTRRLRRAAESLWEPGPGIEMPAQLEVSMPRALVHFALRRLTDSAQRRLWLAGLLAVHSMWRRRLDPFDHRMEYLRRMVAPYEVSLDQVLDEDPALWHDALDGARAKLIRLLPAVSRNITPDNLSSDDNVIREWVSRLAGSRQVTGEFAAAASEYLEVLQVTDLIDQISRLRRLRRALADAERLAELVSELFNKWRQPGALHGVAENAVKTVVGWVQRIYELGISIDEIEQLQWKATTDLVEQVRALSSGASPASVVPYPAARPEILTELDVELRDLTGELNGILDKMDVVTRVLHIPTQQSFTAESDSAGSRFFGPGIRWIRSVMQAALNDPAAPLGASARSVFGERLQHLNNLKEAGSDAWRRQQDADDVRFALRAPLRALDGRGKWREPIGPEFSDVLRADLHHRLDLSAFTEDEAAIESQLNALDMAIAAEIDYEHHTSRVTGISKVIDELELEANAIRFEAFLMAMGGREPQAVFELSFGNFDSIIYRFRDGTDIDAAYGRDGSQNISGKYNISDRLDELRILLEERLHSLRALLAARAEPPEVSQQTGLFQRVHDRVELIAAHVDLLLSSLRDMREWTGDRTNSAHTLAGKVRLVFERLQQLRILHPSLPERDSYARFSSLCRKHGFPELLFRLDRAEYREIVARRRILSLRICSHLQIDPDLVTDTALKSVTANLAGSNRAIIRHRREAGKVTEVTVAGKELAQMKALISDFDELGELEALFLSLEEMDRLDGAVRRILQNAVRAVYGELNLSEQGFQFTADGFASVGEPMQAVCEWAWHECRNMENTFGVQGVKSSGLTMPGLGSLDEITRIVSIWQVTPNSVGQRDLATYRFAVQKQIAKLRGWSPYDVTPDRARRLDTLPGSSRGIDRMCGVAYLILHSAESKARRFHRYSRWVWAIRAWDAVLRRAADDAAIEESTSSELRVWAEELDDLARRWGAAMTQREKIRTRFADWDIDPDRFGAWFRETPDELAEEVLADPTFTDDELRDQAELVHTLVGLIATVRAVESPLAALNDLFDDALRWIDEEGLDPGRLLGFRSTPYDQLRVQVVSTLEQVPNPARNEATYIRDLLDLIGIARSGRSVTPTLEGRLAEAEEVLVRRVIAKNLDPLVFHVGDADADRTGPRVRERADKALREPKFFELAKEFGECDRLVTELDNELDDVLSKAGARIVEVVPAAGDEQETVAALPPDPAVLPDTPDPR
ncbi:MFS transporter [Nocardia altamirensis]|uniref:MFS transporter n=1 Tax=Nocardia altamirensis TaxID=472158 RepID=UPI00114CF8BC|nr:MFS transporter [Nocardia altamirensis]